MDFRNWTHILSIFSAFLKWMSIFYNFKRGACWELWVMSQLHHLWGKESSLPLLPRQLYFKAPWRVQPVLPWVGTHSPSSLLRLWRWGPMSCWACGQHPQHLAGHTHSDHTVGVGTSACHWRRWCYLKEDGEVCSAERCVPYSQATSALLSMSTCLPRLQC